MKRLAAILTTGATAAIAVPLISVATAQAAPEGSVYFSHDGQNCAITPDGVIGCDGWQMVGVLTVPIGGGTVISIPAPQSIRDAGGIHPSYDLVSPTPSRAAIPISTRSPTTRVPSGRSCPSRGRSAR